MKYIKVTFWLLLLLLSGAWLFADTFIPTPFSYFSFRTVFTQYSGIIAIGSMSVAMLLAVRPKWMEQPLNGLDKMYRLHKWLGITALIFATLHWWWAQGTKWMVRWGWLQRPERHGPSGEALSQLEQWLHDQRGTAESVGEWAFYAAVLLIALALIKWFPYHLFRKTHKWLAAVYLVLVYHSLVLIKSEYWSQPIGWVTALLLLCGTISALLVLAGRVGKKCTVKGNISALESYPGVKVIEGRIQLSEGWKRHSPGQFAFVTSKTTEGAHPYTIASAWNPDDPSLTFIVKSLGDWTSQLRQSLKVGTPVSVEGPYGCFDFNDDQPRQIWIGAGIGITPFIAKMKHLAQFPGKKEIDLFHVTRDYDEAAIGKLTEDARLAKVRLHLIVTPRDGRLTPEQIRAAVPEWYSASLWFCGPSAFGSTLRKDFLKHGLPAKHFHQELFEMR
ncbi:ferric reductase [Microbulbifer thermotolerans]|uniref:Ferric reductase n=1 Tax=Microbulbifer thermotolerans TaxID=252514 RepID=A0A143HPH4_MICTH|nr:ferric reductase [Microbulbifer thermotolerans]